MNIYQTGPDIVLWYNSRKEFYMQEFFKSYFDKLDLTSVFENLLTKVISLLILFVLFYIAKKLLHAAVKKIVKPSLKFSNRDAGRQKTISRLLENVFNYILYFFLVYCILSILGLPVSSLLAGAGIAGVAIGMGAQGFLSDVINGFFILFERQLDVGDEVVLTNGPITVSGKVVSVGIRTTQLRGEDQALHFVPNRNITVVSNFSREEEN
jgi:small-conductance mechanosensitive channel